MKKNKLFLSIFSLVSILGLNLVSCNNVEPIKGEDGPTGPIGPAGEDGSDGKDGSIIHTGEGKPSDTLGKDTDLYIDSKTGDLYTKTNGSWSLTTNIKGEDGKDGQNGSDGHNGSSGSNGVDGVPVYSSTILHSNDGYIIPSVGSVPAGEEVTYTFYPYKELEDNEIIGWSVNGEASQVGDTSNSLKVKMEEGGLVIQAQIMETTKVSSSDDLSKALSNLNEGLNVIELEGNINLKSVDINTSNPEEVSSKISTLANDNKKSNSMKAGKIDITTEGNKQVDVTLLSNGKNKTLSFPFLFLEGNNDAKFTFKNIDLVAEYSLDSILQLDSENGFFNFINSRGINELTFQNCTLTYKVPDDFGVSDMQEIFNKFGATPNIINFDGEILNFNHFTQNSFLSNINWGFININDLNNPNLKKITMNQSTIYSSMPFLIEKETELTLNIKNSNFYNVKPYKTAEKNNYLMPFITYYYSIDSINSKKAPKLNIDLTNVNYDLYWDDELNRIPWHLTGGSTATFVIYSHFDDIQGKYNELKPQLNANYRVENNYDVSLKDLVNINLNHFSLYGEEIKSIENHEIVDTGINLEHTICDYCKQDQYYFGYDSDKFGELAIKKDKPLINYMINSAYNCEEAYNQQNYYVAHGFSYNLADANLYPTLEINNKKVY